MTASSNTIYHQGISYDNVVCPVCGVYYFVPTILNQNAIAWAEERSLCCPNGHSWEYVKETEFRGDNVVRLRDFR